MNGRRDAPVRDVDEDHQDLVGIRPDPLRTAALEVAVAWSAPWEPGADERRESVVPELGRVCALVQESYGLGGPPPVGGEATALRLRLLQLLRARVIRAWADEIHGPAEGGTSGRIGGLLRAFEDTREALEADWSRRFGLAMAGSCGIEAAAEVAHGLRSSCSTILFTSEILRDGMFGELNERQREQIEMLYGVATALSADLSDLTDLAWRAREPGEDLRGPLSIDSVVERVRSLLLPVARATGTDLGFRVDIPTPRRGCPGTLRRAIHNLVLFGLRRARGGRVQVDVREESDEAIRVDVEVDGLEEGRQDWTPSDPFAILEPAPGSDDYSFSSPGLRLNATRELVRSMGGSLSVGVETDLLTLSFTAGAPLE